MQTPKDRKQVDLTSATLHYDDDDDDLPPGLVDDAMSSMSLVQNAMQY
jgi:hypothetical protein